MFLRSTIRRKDGKEHRYWSIVGNKRLREAGSSSGRCCISARSIPHRNAPGAGRSGSLTRPPRLSRRRSRSSPRIAARRQPTIRPSSACASRASSFADRASGAACWLALKLWQELRLDRFFAARLPASRKGTRWEEIPFVLVAYRLAPGSERFLHREWFGKSARRPARRRLGPRRGPQAQCLP